MKADLPQNDTYRNYYNRFKELISKNNRTIEEDTELAGLAVTLKDYRIDGSDWNALLDQVADHISATIDVHGATHLAIANRLPIRDANGQFNVLNPTASTHVTHKDYVDSADNARLKKDGSEEMIGPFRMTRSTALGTTAGAISDFFSLAAQTGSNTVKFFTRLIRSVTGTDWSTVDLEFGRIVDSTAQQKISLKGNGDIDLVTTSGKNARVNNNHVFHQGFKPILEELYWNPGQRADAGSFYSQSTSWKLGNSLTLKDNPMYSLDGATPNFRRRIVYNGTFSANVNGEDVTSTNIHYVEIRLQIGAGAEVVIASGQGSGNNTTGPTINVTSGMQNIDTEESVVVRVYTRTTDTGTTDRHRAGINHQGTIRQYYVVE